MSSSSDVESRDTWVQPSSEGAGSRDRFRRRSKATSEVTSAAALVRNKTLPPTMSMTKSVWAVHLV